MWLAHVCSLLITMLTTIIPGSVSMSHLLSSIPVHGVAMDVINNVVHKCPTNHEHYTTSVHLQSLTNHEYYTTSVHLQSLTES